MKSIKEFFVSFLQLFYESEIMLEKKRIGRVSPKRTDSFAFCDQCPRLQGKNLQFALELAVAGFHSSKNHSVFKP